MNLRLNLRIARLLGISNLIESLYVYIERRQVRKVMRKNNKIFCIGANKTGTTSLSKTFKDWHFKVGIQREAEFIALDHYSRDVSKIIQYCNRAEVFQDVPFSLPNAYKYLDKAFPKSKFILTVRDNKDMWYNSCVKFHSKLFGDGENTPNWKDLEKFNYVKPGWPMIIHKKMYDLNENESPYDYKKLTTFYEQHIIDVKNYFQDRPEDLLIINLSNENSFQNLKKFLGIKSNLQTFPWENKTSEIRN